MNINAIINQINNAFSTNSGTQISNSTMQALENGLNRLVNGDSTQAISGKIISITGQDMILELSENELLSAKLDGNLNAGVGDILTFQVKGAGTDKITLSALFENLNQESTVNSALKAANLPDTPANQYMVKSMMSEGLPIDKNSLYEMSNAMKLNATTDVLDLAKMKRLDLPLNEKMVTQFNNYQNLNHEVTKALLDITDSIADGFSEFTKDNQLFKSINILTDSLDILISNDENDTNVKADNNLDANVTSKYNNNENNLNIDNDIKGTNYAENITKDSLINELKVLNNSLKTIDLTDLIKDIDSDSIKGNQLINKLNDIFKNVIPKNSDINSSIDDKVNNDLKADIHKILNSDLFKNSLNKTISDKYEILPEEVGNDKAVSKLYEKLSTDLKNILQNFDVNHSTNTFANSVNNLNDNINFMNELNQTFNYVQIPLKLNNKDASGELYVYTNKKSLADNDGNVSALLHLDMDNLGPMNVHVFMNTNTNNVSTKFYLADESALDLISDNIHILNDRLNKRGYSINCEFINEENKKTVMDTILDDNKNISMISSNSFDARA